MANDWIETTLGDISIDVSYGYTESANTEKVGPKFLRITDIQNGVVDWKSVPYCPIDNSKLDKYVLEKGDIVVARTGNSTGENYIFTGNEETVYASYLIRFRIDENIANPFYVWYSMRSPNWWAFVNSSKTGSAQAGANAKVLGLYPLDLPNLDTQKAIAHILGSLDDKIELNRQMNETLEAMAQTLFKSWFVDFDPVIDNALAAGNAIPDELLERAAQRKGIEKKDRSDIHGLFPDAFEFTEEMGWIPKGWGVDDISSLCEKIQSGGTPRRSVPEYWEDSTIPWLTSGEVRQTIITKVENKISESGLSNSSAKWLVSGATVVAMYGATAGQVAYIDKPLTTNQAVCGLIPKKGYQFFNYVTLSRSVAHFEGRATGSAQQNINKGMIESTRVVVPSSVSSDSFEEHCEVIFSKWVKNLHENETLAKIRDTLLPKLISGELYIADAAALVDEAI